MRVFVTGTSGWIGSAIVARVDRSRPRGGRPCPFPHTAHQLEAAGAIVRRGDLGDPDGLAAAPADSDEVIHLAFQHELASTGRFAGAHATDRRAVEAMGASLADSDRPFVLASGLLGMKPGQVAGVRR